MTTTIQMTITSSLHIQRNGLERIRKPGTKMEKGKSLGRILFGLKGGIISKEAKIMRRRTILR
jgi:hypothetical protein